MSALTQIPFGSVSGDYRPSALLSVVPEELTQRFPVDWTRYEDDGLGEALGAAFRASNGHCFGLVHHVCSRETGRPCTKLETLHQSPDEAATLDAALSDLGLTTQETAWIREDIHLTPFDLVRQDDHGIEFCIGTYRCHADAAAQQRRLAAAVHKQDYWIRRHE